MPPHGFHIPFVVLGHVYPEGAVWPQQQVPPVGCVGVVLYPLAVIAPAASTVGVGVCLRTGAITPASLNVADTAACGAVEVIRGGLQQETLCHR
eukprot:SAG25_NODE_445_length_7958_cov_9.538109_2_plen_94_part_00